MHTTLSECFPALQLAKSYASPHIHTALHPSPVRIPLPPYLFIELLNFKTTNMDRLPPELLTQILTNCAASSIADLLSISSVSSVLRVSYLANRGSLVFEATKATIPDWEDYLAPSILLWEFDEEFAGLWNTNVERFNRGWVKYPLSDEGKEVEQYCNNLRQTQDPSSLMNALKVYYSIKFTTKVLVDAPIPSDYKPHPEFNLSHQSLAFDEAFSSTGRRLLNLSLEDLYQLAMRLTYTPYFAEFPRNCTLAWFKHGSFKRRNANAIDDCQESSWALYALVEQIRDGIFMESEAFMLNALEDILASAVDRIFKRRSGRFEFQGDIYDYGTIVDLFVPRGLFHSVACPLVCGKSRHFYQGMGVDGATRWMAVVTALRVKKRELREEYLRAWIEAEEDVLREEVGAALFNAINTYRTFSILGIYSK